MTDLLTVTNADHAFIKHEHAELEAGIERVHQIGGRVGSVTPRELADEVLHVLDWFEKVLAPHAVWEDHMLYDRIDERAGTTWATRLMRYEHEQIRRIAARLAGDRQRLLAVPTHELLTELRAHLFAFEALVRAHIEREDVFLFPLLEQ
jgi:hemerythrin-like domain-containing protein